MEGLDVTVPVAPSVATVPPAVCFSLFNPCILYRVTLSDGIHQPLDVGGGWIFMAAVTDGDEDGVPLYLDDCPSVRGPLSPDGCDHVAPTLQVTPASPIRAPINNDGWAVAEWAVTATDDVALDGGPFCNVASPTHFSPAASPVTVTCDARDVAGNVGRLEFDLVADGGHAPQFGHVDDVIAEATSGDGAAVTYVAPTALDEEDGPLASVCQPPPGSLFGLGTTAVECEATDSSGLTATVSFDVIVRDTTPPTFSGVPADVVVNSPSGGAVPVSYAEPVATDIVEGDVSVRCLPPSGSLFAVGSTPVTCTAVDSSGNAATPVTFNVVVRTAPPVPPGAPGKKITAGLVKVTLFDARGDGERACRELDGLREWIAKQAGKKGFTAEAAAAWDSHLAALRTALRCDRGEPELAAILDLLAADGSVSAHTRKKLAHWVDKVEDRLSKYQFRKGCQDIAKLRDEVSKQKAAGRLRSDLFAALQAAISSTSAAVGCDP